MIERQALTPSTDGGHPSPEKNGRGKVERGEYRYLAYSPDRTIVQGVIKAASLSDAGEVLVRAGYQPVELRQVRWGLLLKRLFRSKRVKDQDLLILTDQLAVLLRAGIPLVSSLEALQEQFKNPELREALEVITEDVRGGMPLSEALGKYPHIFSNFYTQMIVLGEQSGDLEGILEQTSAYLGRELALRKTIRRAMFYPVLVLMLAAVTVVIMMKFVIPSVVEMFEVLSVPLPLITRIVLEVARFINENQTALGVAFLLVFLVMFLAFRRPKAKQYAHQAVLRLPVLKTIVIYRELGRFARVTGLMLHNGLPLPTILAMVIGVASNLEIKEAFRVAQANVIAGDTLSSGLADKPFIPPMFKQMVRIGEISGNLEGNLASIADFYDRELDSLIESAVAMLEPIMTISIGVVIGFVALTIIVPIYSLIGSAGG